MTPQPRLLALATAVPPHILDQSKVRACADRLFAQAPAEFSRMLPVFDHAGIATRHFCVPLDWHFESRGWAERNRIYLASAADLLEKVTRDCLAAAKLNPQEIDGIVVASTTGVATPSLDAILMERLDFRRDMQRLPVFGLGCAGGVIGLARTASLARAEPEGRFLFLVVELCSLWFQRSDHSKSSIVAAALFGDGAAGAIVSCAGNGPLIGPGGEHTWPASLDVMGWGVDDTGLRALFSRHIPTLIRTRLREVTDAFLARNGLRLGDIDAMVCHPGGAKVLAALESAFELGDSPLAEARSVLSHYGNMSAATVMFVLKDVLRTRTRGRLLMTALGPGFTAGFLLVEGADAAVRRLRARPREVAQPSPSGDALRGRGMTLCQPTEWTHTSLTGPGNYHSCRG